MRHDPEALATAYLMEMSAADRLRHDRHLLDCDACWQEVSLARRGRELAESLRQPAPPGLRELLRATLAVHTDGPTGRPGAVDPLTGSDGPAAVPPERPRPRTRAAAAAASLLVAASVASALLAIPEHSWWHPRRPASTVAAAQSAIDAALTSFRTQHLPGTAVPSEPAPDLTALGLQLVAAGAGRLGLAEVTMYSYRDAHGARLAVYRSSHPFAETDQAHEVPGAETAWTMKSDDVTVLCGPGTHTTLLLGTDPATIHRAGLLLDLT